MRRSSEEYRMEHHSCNLFRQMLIFVKRNRDRKNDFKVSEIAYHEAVKFWQFQQKCITWIEWPDSLDVFRWMTWIPFWVYAKMN